LDEASPDAGDYVKLTLQQPATISLKISARQTCAAKDGARLIWSGDVILAHMGQTFTLPIPKAALFGKSAFAIALGESGAITTLQYAKETGVAQVLNVAGAAVPSLQGPTAAQRAADIKAEADLIAAQERLVRCLANRVACI
jgi:hypothetical protein